jgi:5-methylcytosine-specific restriction protein A
MNKPPRPCSVCGRAPVYRSGRCELHYRQSERRRGSSTERGYGARHVGWFRRVVLQRDPICVACGEYASTHADHYPKTRRQLARLGLDPDDPQYGRGLCQSCHNGWTASQSHSY